MRTRRSGISNLIGAVFFILIVVLMVGVLVLTFNNFNGFVESQHTSNAQTLRQQQASLNIANLTYGGITSTNGFKYSANGQVALVPNALQRPILPVSNMNFTSGLQGWTTSQSYSLVTDSANVQTVPSLITFNSTFFPSQPMTFTLSVTNNDPLGQPYEIAKVSLLVDSNWAVTSPQPVALNWGPTAILTNSPPSVVRNNITWVSGYPGFDLGPGQNQLFTWSATVPRAYGTYYQTVVLSWIKNNLGPPAGPYVDTAIGTLNATVTRAEVSPSGTAGSSSTNINCGQGPLCPALGPFTPSGVVAGYDSQSLSAASQSGTGTAVVAFKPTLNSVPIGDGQQLGTTVSFSTVFTLDSATVAKMVTAGCCTMSWGSNLDNVQTMRNSLIYYQVFLTNPNGIKFSLPVGGTSCGASPNAFDYLDPSTLNDFGSTGWFYDYVCFNPSTSIPAWLNAGQWFNGQYKLTVSITMIAPGQNPLSNGYPPGISVHLDDIGLAFKQTVTSYYGSTAANTPKDFQIPTGLSTGQAQGIELLINASVAKGIGIPSGSNTTIYAYIADNSRFVYNPPFWAQVGSASFINSALIDVSIPLPAAAYYLNTTLHTQGGKLEVGDLDVRVNATSPFGPSTVNLNVFAVVQTFNQTRITVGIQSHSPDPIKLQSMVITGPSHALSVSFSGSFYLGPGQKIIVPETFIWIPGQIYTVTVTTTTGLTFSRSFTAPLA